MRGSDSVRRYSENAQPGHGGEHPEARMVSDALPMMRADFQSEQGNSLADLPHTEQLAGANVDVRTVLYFKLRDDVVKGMLPQDWEIDPPSAGYAAGANFRATFIDTIAAYDAAGASRAAVCYMHIGIPARKHDSRSRGLMLCTGLSPSGPGPYRTNLTAAAQVERRILHQAHRSTTEESWQFDGDAASVSLRLGFTRGTVAREEASLHVYSRVAPEFCRIYRYDQCIDVIQAGAADGQRLQQFEFRVTGDPIAHIFDGTEQLISAVSVPSYSRTVFLREPCREAG